MTYDEVKKLVRQATAWAKSNGFERDADDMAQHVLIGVARNRKADVRSMCIDYVRSNYGRTGKNATKKQLNQALEKRFYDQLNNEMEDSSQLETVKLLDSDFPLYQNRLNPEHRAIVTLYFRWGLTLAEIGDCFGVSEQHICGKLRTAKEILQAQDRA